MASGGAGAGGVSWLAAMWCARGCALVLAVIYAQSCTATGLTSKNGALGFALLASVAFAVSANGRYLEARTLAGRPTRWHVRTATMWLIVLIVSALAAGFDGASGCARNVAREVFGPGYRW